VWQRCDVVPELAYSAEESAAMDRWLLERGFTLEQLMGAAGGRLASAIGELCRVEDLSRVVCLVGPGNNGGDAVVAARLLEQGRSAAPAGDGPDGERSAPADSSDREVSPVPSAAGVRSGTQGLSAVHIWRPLVGEPAPSLDRHTLLVDGLFGVGLSRPLDGAAAAAVETVARSPARVLAVDIPSGLHATTGAVLGVAPKATWTLSFVGPKQGFFVGAGPRHVGLWRAVEIGFPAAEARDWVTALRASGGSPAGG